ncbi:hypothetical protein Sulac_2400 [Sulfobacillus acidophilus DSM 10332]|uniref:Uncharacterized protein n=1 Tax=Sulfobacillus acidophilus (strain ATCC 700253 / DSM 10332 / NAL) TaxID=679936 RepID=G8TVE4_SULAD|nr:hypothetical protein Sulac_2400 [Sulfobacillus acidophilus DSM 10332]
MSELWTEHRSALWSLFVAILLLAVFMAKPPVNASTAPTTHPAHSTPGKASTPTMGVGCGG